MSRRFLHHPSNRNVPIESCMHTRRHAVYHENGRARLDTIDSVASSRLILRQIAAYWITLAWLEQNNTTLMLVSIFIHRKWQQYIPLIRKIRLLPLRIAGDNQQPAPLSNGQNLFAIATRMRHIEPHFHAHAIPLTIIIKETPNAVHHQFGCITITFQLYWNVIFQILPSERHVTHTRAHPPALSATSTHPFHQNYIGKSTGISVGPASQPIWDAFGQ